MRREELLRKVSKLRDRGWSKVDGNLWVSPHNGKTYTMDDAIFVEVDLDEWCQV